ncbi:DgyrCDS4487 [Dimorphilus gyrociliatus]|uniref:DgyrCDS4487 n=1 Tax=Dimorphilus gyrociliatus TaxID=2664684 RepID=A0A7I8VIL1_9ANNE|nr:DgyrCDS4487 [Dimorphilus gyrociliatus]
MGNTSGKSLRRGTADKSSSSLSLKGREDTVENLSRWITAEKRRTQDILEENYDVYKQRMHLLKHMFKQLDPNIMATATFVNHGDLELAVKYDVSRRQLLVKIIQARDLRARDLRGKTSDPYVKLWLQKERGGEVGNVYKTRIMPKTLSPKWNEIFSFPIDNMDLLDGTFLIFQVWDNDITERDDMIGENVVSISSMNISSGRHEFNAWYSLKASTDLNITGTVSFDISFEMPDVLTIKVLKGEGLTQKSTDRLPNCRVKLQVPGIALCFETEIKENTIDPVWEETFEFPVTLDQLCTKYIVLHVIDVRDGQQNETLGQIIYDLDNITPHSGFNGTMELADLKNSERLRSRWFQHFLLQEFRESLTAHANFHQPSFLFKNSEGTKVHLFPIEYKVFVNIL